MRELFTAPDRRLIPVFNTAVNEAMALHMGLGKGAELASLSDVEFAEVVKTSPQQPLNPVEVGRRTLGYSDDATASDIQAGYRDEYKKLVALYMANSIDPTDALQAAEDMIGLTEAWIAGYSRLVGNLAFRIKATDPKATALERWNDSIWVPEEDGHDRTLSFIRHALGRDNLTGFYSDHIGHMQTKIHPKLDNLPSGTIYLGQQEGSTGPSYRNWGALLGPVLSRPTKEIGDQEHKHTRLYGKVGSALMEVDPDRTVIAVEETSDGFDMPARDGIDDYVSRAKELGVVGLLDPVDILDVQRPMIVRLGIKGREFKTNAAKAAQAKLTDPDGKYGQAIRDKTAERLQAIREWYVKQAQRSGKLMPAIIGVTVVADPRTGELSFPMSK